VRDARKPTLGLSTPNDPRAEDGEADRAERHMGRILPFDVLLDLVADDSHEPPSGPVDESGLGQEVLCIRISGPTSTGSGSAAAVSVGWSTV